VDEHPGIAAPLIGGEVTEDMASEPGSPTDAQVIEQSLRSPEAFATLFDPHAGAIYRYAAIRLGTDVADDVMSETFYLAFRGRRRFDLSRENARPWLYGIATRARIADQQVPIPRDDQYVYTKELLVETGKDGSTKAFIDENWRSVDQSKPSRISERGKSWIAPPAKSNERVWPPLRYADLRQLPLDPKRLLIAIRDWPGAPRWDTPMGSGNLDYELAYVHLLYLLHGWSVMPSGLRSATFEAIGAIPGVVVTNDVVDARGRHGIGISRPGGQVIPNSMLILDSGTYDYLGYKVDNQSISLEAYGVVDRIGQRP
jgi:hypothetical protein